MNARPPFKDRLFGIKAESIKHLQVSDKAVGRSFNEARLTISLAFGFLLVGILLVAQMRGSATFSESLERQSDQNLAIIIQEITVENNVLRSEVVRLQMRLLEARRATEDRTQLLNEATKELNSISLMAGLEPATGAGIRVTITDSERVLLPQDFVKLVHELRAGGAEAIAVNGVRVTATSGFAGRDGQVELDGVILSSDYEILALGQPGNLSQAIELPGGLRSTLSTFPGVVVEVAEKDDLTVPEALHSGFEVAVPVEDR